MPAQRGRSQSDEQNNAEEDDLATFERMMTRLRTRSEEKRRQVRTEVMAAYVRSVDGIEETMHAQFTRVRDSVRDDWAGRKRRVQGLLVQRADLVRDIDALVDEVNGQVGDMHAFMRSVREEVSRAGLEK